jgi:hypothetical protein
MPNVAVMVRGAPTFLHIEGSSAACASLVEHLEGKLHTSDQDPVAVKPDHRKPDLIDGLIGIGLRIYEGPVRIEVENNVALMVGGPSELTSLLKHMRGLLESEPGHHEILRVFDDWYWYLDASTHIDFKVT